MVTPTPDVVTRVFMLFKGVSETAAWEGSKDRDVDWAKVVGVDVERALDGRLFRVLEWGGMEVLGR